MERENSTVARTLTWLLILVMCALWAWMVKCNFNILISAVLSVGLFSFTLNKLDQGAWKGFHRTIIKHRPATIAFGSVLITSIMMSAKLNGDWDGYHVPSTCLAFLGGILHIHHWAKAQGVVAWHADIFAIAHLDDEATRNRLSKKYGWRTLALGSIVVAFGVTTYFISPKNTSLWLDTTCYGAFLVLLAVVCFFGNLTNHWTKVYLALSLGTAVGILIHGGVSALPEFWSHSIPSSLIFWHPGADPACRLP